MSRRTNQELKEDYLRWLEPQLIDPAGNRNGNSYWGLIELMFSMPFTWSVEQDDNRLMDGLELRVEFANLSRLSQRTMHNFGPCTFLEVLLGLSRRLAFAAGGNAVGWAWELLTNVELHRMSDPLTPGKQRRAEEIMLRVIGRTYAPDGTGGFFPLAWPDGDQTRIELWYQMNAFIAEIHPEHGHGYRR